MNVLHPRLIARATDAYWAARNPHALADAVQRSVGLHKPLPVWERPEEYYGACKEACEDASHPHGPVVGYACSYCIVLNDRDEYVPETYPCEQIQQIGLALGLCEEVEPDEEG